MLCIAQSNSVPYRFLGLLPVFFTTLCVVSVGLRMCVCVRMHVHIHGYMNIYTYINTLKYIRLWGEVGAGVETQKNVWGEIGRWGRVPFNEPYAPSLSTIYDGA